MNLVGRWAGWGILLVACPLTARHGAAPVSAEERTPGSRLTSTRLTDAQAAELAKQALAAQDPASIRATLSRLRDHSFKSSKVPERELVLYAQGMLEARLGNFSAAVVALKKLERQWPKSPFMGEGQTILAEDAVAHRRYKECFKNHR